jgi:pyruvate formate lyase activating enzyme
MSTLISGTIFDIKKFSLHDGPGIRTTIFFKGCPLSCIWCHNPEGISRQIEIHFWEKRCISCFECVEACAHKALSFSDNQRNHLKELCQGCGACAQICPTKATELVGTKVSVSDLMLEIEKDVIFYDQSGGGVTISGGEPLLQINFLEALLTACHNMGIHTIVDTSGYIPFKYLHRIQPFTDIFLYDVKFIDPTIHQKCTGVSNKLILDNLKKLTKTGSKVIPRIPIIPGINDSEENLLSTGRLLESLGSIQEVNILPYHNAAINKYIRMGNNYPLIELETPSNERMVEIARNLEIFNLKVKIGG